MTTSWLDPDGRERLSGSISPDPTFNGGTISGNLEIENSAPELKLRVTGDVNSGLDMDAVDQGGGVVDAVLRLRGKGGGLANLVVDGQTANGESASLVGNGQLQMFTVAGVQAIQCWDASGNTIQFGTTVEGAPFVAVLTAPDSGSLSAGQVALWFDDTNGAAKLMIKGKSADGTVVTGQVALS